MYGSHVVTSDVKEQRAGERTGESRRAAEEVTVPPGLDSGHPGASRQTRSLPSRSAQPGRKADTLEGLRRWIVQCRDRGTEEAQGWRAANLSSGRKCLQTGYLGGGGQVS